MQLLIIRHALPLRSEPGQGSDPDLSEDGIEQAKRLPDALARYPITRLVSSPQKRAIQTAQPVADALGLPIDIDDRLAEYDRDLSHYTPVEQISNEDMQRLANGDLPGNVDADAFVERVQAGVDDIVRSAGREDTVALFSHGGVINAVVHKVMGTERLLCAQVDYAGVTRVLWSSSRNTFFVAGINSTEHVWDLLPRNQQW
ncbi:histidine phosphatase family protein [Mycolicibacterium flavescens]|uniref:Phosphoglycerate kinase n=1 Tax=Mycolicibacterium flavescens TaxID=1776 RepID=A0A1E3RAX0_MYCFV|nr:histidine phosphatase family protein [Mycolicibacterium flavescens]MCV7282965.1 histidine phosphatase family protein [Mycolicibacterium flavescens]ODQ86532.1 phosphoglycerate kinase [Mycolicibacterium flavescens]